MKISKMNHEYKTWKEQCDDDRRKHNDKIIKLEKESERRQPQLHQEQTGAEENARSNDEAQQGNTNYFVSCPRKPQLYILLIQEKNYTF